MPQREPHLPTTTRRLVTGLGLLLVSLTCNRAYAAARGELASASDLLFVLKPLVPLFAGAGLFKLTRSHLVAAGLPALVFGAFGAWDFYRLPDGDPLSDVLFGLGLYGIPSGLLALAGSGYVHLIGAQARRLGTRRTAIVHALGITVVAMAFVLLFLTYGWNTIAIALYLILLAVSFGASAVTGSFGGVVATMTFALLAIVFIVLVAALLSSVRDLNQAGMLIFYAPPAVVPIVAIAALGKWFGGNLRARRSDDRGG